MNNIPPYIITDDSITIVVNGKPFTSTVSNANFSQIKERIVNENFDGIEELFDTGKAVGNFTNGNIIVEDNAVRYKGEVVDNHVVDRILSFMRQGWPYKPLCNFLDKLMQNPSRRAVNELYRFLEHKNMPLTPEGNFLAYKSVRADWTDHHTGTVDNSVGATIPRMGRNLVCDDANVACSSGYHAGSLDYAKSFGGGDSRLLIVEIDPTDVISIPHDCNCQKLRCCFYKIVGTFERPLTEDLNNDYSDNEDLEEKEYLSFNESFNEGFTVGSTDFENDVLQTPEEALDLIQSANPEVFNEEGFIEGYDKGYKDAFDNFVAEKEAHISNAYSCKSNKVAKVKANAKTSPKRDKFGRFAK